MKLPAIDISRFCMRRIQVDVRHAVDRSYIEITCIGYVSDVDNGDETQVMSRETVPYATAAEHPEALRQLAHRALRSMLMHELDECLYIDGVRLCAEPHPEQSRKTA